jgi:hypothetical protein
LVRGDEAAVLREGHDLPLSLNLTIPRYIDPTESTDADLTPGRPGDAEVYAMAEDLRELLVEMRAKVEAKLDRG